MIHERKAVSVRNSGAVLCPGCGNDNVHINTWTNTAAGRYTKGGGVLFTVDCEHCTSVQHWVLHVGFHKGSTYLEWCRDDDAGAW